MTTRLIVIEGTNTDLDGQWREVSCSPLPLHRLPGPSTTLVPTGCVRWQVDDVPAEIYVPQDRLDVWRAEHDLERL